MVCDKGVKIPTPTKKYDYWCIEMNGDRFMYCFFDKFRQSSSSKGKAPYLENAEIYAYREAPQCGQFNYFQTKDYNLDTFQNKPMCFSDQKLLDISTGHGGRWVVEDPKKWWKDHIYFKDCELCDATPQPPDPQPEDTTEGTGTNCPTSGIYGGYGQKLTDIKLFLYANNVTNGTIKLNKPQLEVGTVATDWRPNADEAIKHYTPAYKQVRGLAIQQGSNGKKYLEIPTVEGTIYGADLWGGDTAKLLKDEIAELKEQIKELKNQIK